jgi:hypothetical protein
MKIARVVVIDTPYRAELESRVNDYLKIHTCLDVDVNHTQYGFTAVLKIGAESD